MHERMSGRLPTPTVVIAPIDCLTVPILPPNLYSAVSGPIAVPLPSLPT